MEISELLITGINLQEKSTVLSSSQLKHDAITACISNSKTKNVIQVSKLAYTLETAHPVETLQTYLGMPDDRFLTCMAGLSLLRSTAIFFVACWIFCGESSQTKYYVI